MTTTCCLVASDIHCLSTFAVLRPGFVTEEGNEIGLNKFQKWLWGAWEDCIAEVDTFARGRKYFLILNGDLIEGNHHRTKEILACSEAEHMRAALYTLEDLTARASRIAIVEGTECHTGDFEGAMGSILKATRDPVTGKHVHKTFHFEMNGVPGMAYHHMPTTKRVYLEASGLGIELGNAQLSAARLGYPVPKIVLMAHRHRQGVYTDGNAIAACSPAWQGLTRFGRKVVPNGKLEPGFLWFDWEGKAVGELPEVMIISRKPDPPEAIRVEAI